MKSKHLAKADYLRQLRKYVSELYEFGDFTCVHPERLALSSKLEGYAVAGTTIEIVSQKEVQDVIDGEHLKKFGEGREERRLRILEEKKQVADQMLLDDAPSDWEIYDSPAKDRKK